MKTLTIGNGFIASHLSYERIPERLELNNIQIRDLLNRYKPDCLVNCVGYCGTVNIDNCELEKSRTYQTNVTLPLILADECEKLGIHLIHLASGCIYYGQSPNTQWVTPQYIANAAAVQVDLGWKEEDFAHPKSFYSKTKYSTDLVLGQMSNVTTLRLRMPISPKNSPRNFINKIRGYRQLIDIPNSVTMVTDLVRCIDWAAQENKFGIFHVTNPQPLSAARVMQEYQKYVPEHEFEIINEAQLDQLTTAKRSNCILNTQKLNAAGFFMTPSEEALEECMLDYITNIREENV